jgi:hypothetical protein
MSPTRYKIIELEDEPFENIISEEEFEDDEPEGFRPQKPGQSLDAPCEDRNHVTGWDPSESFFYFTIINVDVPNWSRHLS